MNRNRRRACLRILALTPFALHSAGCASVWQLLRHVVQDPEIRLRRLQVESIALDQVKARFFLAVTNPNPINIHLGGVEYALALDDNPMLKGLIDEPIDLPARREASIEVPVTVPLGSSTQAILRLLNQKKVTYALDTRFRFQLPSGTLALPLRFEGEFPVPKLPTVQVQEFRFTSIQPGGVGVSITARVTNPNDFPLPIDRLRFVAKLNGRTILRNQEIENVSLQAQQTRDLKLNFSVGLLDAGLTVLSLSERPEMTWELDGTLESGVLALPVRLDGRVRLR